MSVGRVKLKGRTIYLNDRKLNAKGSLAITTKCQKVIQIPGYSHNQTYTSLKIISKVRLT